MFNSDGMCKDLLGLWNLPWGHFWGRKFCGCFFGWKILVRTVLVVLSFLSQYFCTSFIHRLPRQAFFGLRSGPLDFFGCGFSPIHDRTFLGGRRGGLFRFGLSRTSPSVSYLSSPPGFLALRAFLFFSFSPLVSSPLRVSSRLLFYKG